MQSKDSTASASPSPIPLSVPVLRGNEWKYVKDCLDTGWVSSVGSYVDRFEQEVAKFVGAGYGVATSSGTAALHVALQIVGVEPEDEVLVPALSFIAPANAVRYLGAWPVFIDAEPRYWQMDVEKVESFLQEECVQEGSALRNKSTGRRVRAILPVHILGHPCDLDVLRTLASRYDLRLVEDATESLGAQYKGRAIGSLGDVACFSFNGNKLLTTGGGGMLVTHDEAWARQAKYLTTQAKDDAIEYIHCRIGYNYRLTNLQAAVGCAQLEQLEHFVAFKRRLAARYRTAFDSLPQIQVMSEAPWATSSFWLSTVLLDPAMTNIDRRTLRKILAERHIETRPLWQPLHRSPAHRGAQSYHCVVADQIQEQALSLPSSTNLTDAEQERVIDDLKMALPRLTGKAAGQV
ncbi:MAG TPA: LegC family aminotransferase [Nitrospira sp.]|nr:LegC family aminotransferase [Nitrospira sp.]